MNDQFRFVCPTVDDTKALAVVIGSAVRGGELLELKSDLGGGKTTFVKGLAQGMGINDVVQSPSFTISQVHKAAKNLELHHFDFYRLSDAGIMRAELAETLAQPNAVVAIEWGEIVHDVLDGEKLVVNISVGSGEERIIRIACPKKYDYIMETLYNHQHNKDTA